MSRHRKVYEHGRLVPIEHSERMRKAQTDQSLIQGLVAGVFWGGGIVALAFTVGMAWAIGLVIAGLIAIAVKDAGGGPTVPPAGTAGNLGGTG